MTTATNKKSPYPSRSGSKSTCSKSEFISSSKDNPCPVCDRTKDGDCSMTADKGLVLCYTEGKDGKPVQSANGYHFNGQYSDSYHGVSTRAQYTKKKPRTKAVTISPAQRLKPAKQVQKNVQRASAHVETEVDHLTLMIAEGHETLESAQVTLAAWCKEYGYDKYTASQQLKAKVKNADTQGIQVSSDEVHKLVRDYRLIKKAFGDRLRFNSLFMQPELDGELFDPDMARVEMIVTHKVPIKSCQSDISTLTLKAAKERTFSPVVEYLEKVHSQYGNSTDILENFTARYFGTTKAIHQTMMKRFFIAAVARAFEPGCKQDCTLILKGAQSCGKSTFFKVLASKPWFDDSYGATKEADERLKLHQSWIIEWGEIEAVYRRKNVSQLKAFLSCETDKVRPPYGRSQVTLHRPSVIVGSTNEDEFLADTTGNRRFWVVPMNCRLDRNKLREERDHIWAAAVALYKADVQWHLTDEESIEIDADRKQYETVHPWFDPIQDFVAGLTEVTTTEILEHGVQLDVPKFTNFHSKQVAGVMRQLGWEATNNILSHQGIRKRGWQKK